MANPSGPSRSGSIANGPPSAGVNASQPSTSGAPGTQNLNQIVSGLFYSVLCIRATTPTTISKSLHNNHRSLFPRVPAHRNLSFFEKPTCHSPIWLAIAIAFL
jgi:hypothetical protein